MIEWKIICMSGFIFGFIGFLTGYDLGKTRGYFIAKQKIQSELQQQQWQSTIQGMFGGKDAT
jgi:hypothetical protein